MPETLHLSANRKQDIQRAAEILRGGGLVAFPTETVYGLGANAFSQEAVSRIFAAKQRPAWDPLIVHVDSLQAAERVVLIEPAHRERIDVMAKAFWPGPLTLLLPRAAEIPDAVTAGRGTVGVRVPSHPVAQALLRASGLPLAAPSANRFGHVSPTTAEHVLEDLDGRIDAVLDGGPTPVGVESTVVDPTQTSMMIYRAGAVTAEMLSGLTGAAVEIFTREALRGGQTPESLPSPGVGIRHYAPEATLILSGPTEKDLRRDIVEAGNWEGPVGVMLPSDWQLEGLPDLLAVGWGRWSDPESLAHGLFAALRGLESRGARTIICPLPQAGGLLDAVRDRLLKAARPR